MSSAFPSCRVLGTIQPYGILAIVAAGAQVIEAVSENVDALLGLKARDLIGAPLSALLDGPDAQSFGAKLHEAPLGMLNPHDLTLRGVAGRNVRVECTVHRRDAGHWIIEFEPSDEIAETLSYDESQAPIERLTRAQDIPTLLADAARDIREISAFEHVTILQFNGARQCTIVAESMPSGGPQRSFGEHTRPTDVLMAERRLGARPLLRIVPDTAYVPCPVLGADAAGTSVAFDLSRATLCAASPGHLAELKAAGWRAEVTISIVIRGNVWGFIACRNGAPRRLGYRKRAVCELIGHMLAWQLDARLKLAALANAEQEQRTYARQLRALHAIASTTSSKRKDQIDAALQLGLEQLELDWGFLGVIDYARAEVLIENSVSRDGTLVVAAGTHTPLGATIIGGIARMKDVRIIPDITALDERPAFAGWASYIAVPLFIGDVHYGVIGFTSREVRRQPFSEANVEFIAVAGELIVSAIERGLQRERLETSETRYRALAEAIPEMVWVVDAADRFEYVNARWTNYTGLTLEQSRALGAQAVYDDAYGSVVNAGRSMPVPAEYDCEVRLRRADGTTRWHLVRSVPFHDVAGDAGKWLVTATDIEERKSAQALLTDVHDAALAATEAKSRFLATMSHEIRTPMNAVIGMTELLLLTPLGDEQREYVEIVHDSGESLLRVLNDILDYSKIEAGKLTLETVHFDLPGQIESVVELVNAQYQLKGVKLTTRLAAGVPAAVVGDPGRLRQILLNLTGNALKFTPVGGDVAISVDAGARRGETVPVRFTVQDTGIGIPPEVQGRLFQPFSQGDESTTREYGGTGLGLSICAQLVALMNGTIGVRSIPGSGSAFWFELPLEIAKAAPRALDGRKSGTTPTKPIVIRAEKILLVEDNEINTFLALKQLKRIGFSVSAVNNGRQAVEAVARAHFDLIFMDCHMPEMDGFAATREIRRLEAGGTRRVPIVAMTADARTEDHQNCLRAGMDDYVSKPTSLASLHTVLDRWLPMPDRRHNTRDDEPPADGSMLDTTQLRALGGDRGAALTLLVAAASSIKADFARIEKFAATRDFAAAADAAGRLAGTSATIQLPHLGELGAAVERAALVATPTAAIPAALLDELRVAVARLSKDADEQAKLPAPAGST